MPGLPLLIAVLAATPGYWPRAETFPAETRCGLLLDILDWPQGGAFQAVAQEQARRLGRAEVVALVEGQPLFRPSETCEDDRFRVVPGGGRLRGQEYLQVNLLPTPDLREWAFVRFAAAAAAPHPACLSERGTAQLADQLWEEWRFSPQWRRKGPWPHKPPEHEGSPGVVSSCLLPPRERELSQALEDCQERGAAQQPGQCGATEAELSVAPDGVLKVLQTTQVGQAGPHHQCVLSRLNGLLLSAGPSDCRISLHYPATPAVLPPAVAARVFLQAGEEDRAREQLRQVPVAERCAAVTSALSTAAPGQPPAARALLVGCKAGDQTIQAVFQGATRSLPLFEPGESCGLPSHVPGALSRDEGCVRLELRPQPHFGAVGWEFALAPRVPAPGNCARLEGELAPGSRQTSVASHHHRVRLAEVTWRQNCPSEELSLGSEASSALTRCYREFLQKEPLLCGTLRTQLTFRATGGGPQVKVLGGTVQSKSLRACAELALGRLDFPAIPLPCSVEASWDFGFRPGRGLPHYRFEGSREQ